MDLVEALADNASGLYHNLIMPSPTVSVLVLAQDVVCFLPRLLANVQPIADEIVVVDGGSRDATADVVEREPKARLFCRPFDGDFAAQKNFGLGLCRGSWILVVDADELLSDALRAKIGTLVRAPRARWYKFPRYWIVSDALPLQYVRSPFHYPDRQLRLFRNEPPFRYASDCPVHVHFPKQGRGPGKRLREGHILHFALMQTSRRDREHRAERYQKIEPGSAETNRIYLYEDFPHAIRRCSEDLTETLPP